MKDQSMDWMILVLGWEMDTMGSVTPSTASPEFKGAGEFPTSVKGRGGHGQNDERVGGPPTGPLNGNVTEHEWIRAE